MTSRPAPGRQASEKRGRRAESLAALMLRLKGYAILTRRYRCPVGEIDLVARRGHTLAMVEVKARACAEDAAFAITPHQQHRIARAAEHFLSANPGHMGFQLRFDATLAVHDARRID
jgi:putative endonuclease